MNAFWMVYMQNNTGPTCQHETQEAAEREAERLYNLNGRKDTIHVLKVVKTLKPIANFEWHDVEEVKPE